MWGEAETHSESGLAIQKRVLRCASEIGNVRGLLPSRGRGGSSDGNGGRQLWLAAQAFRDLPGKPDHAEERGIEELGSAGNAELGRWGDGAMGS
jgi:hypothetical protein